MSHLIVCRYRPLYYHPLSFINSFLSWVLCHNYLIEYDAFFDVTSKENMSLQT